MKKNAWIIITLLTGLLSVTGCAINTYNAKSGSGDPTAQRAIFAPEKNVAISSIDGNTVFVTARNWWIPVITKTKASVMPGTHTLTVKYAKTGWSSLGCEVTFDARSGKTYVVKGKQMEFDNSSGFAAVKRPRIATVVIWVEDAETGEKVFDGAECVPAPS